ncbi:hypothetical protein CA951_02480 [Rhodococcus sp. NCIMB 12038]|nr:hypothetical protein CA951_02480 [Rhodococcus sp. NCIMB 12038]
MLGKIFGDDEPKPTGTDTTTAQQAATPLAQPNPYQQMVAGPQLTNAGAMVPPAAGIAGAGAGIITAAPPVTAASAGTTTPATTKSDDDTKEPSFLESVGKTLLAAGAGGVTGFMLKSEEADEQGLEGGEKISEIAKGVLAGAGSGAFTKMGYDAIQEEGGGLKAGLHGGIAGMLASTLKEGGPGLGASFATAFGAGAVSNLAHDKLEERGSSKLADALAGGGIASSLGYVGLGDGKAAGLLGLGGAGAGATLGALDGAGGLSGMLAQGSPLDKLSELAGNDAAPQKDSGHQLS